MIIRKGESTISLLVLYVVLLGTSPGLAQSTDWATSSHVLYEMTHIIRSDGSLLIGEFVGIKGDSVSLIVAGMPQRVSRSEILKLTIQQRIQRGRTAISGMLLGVYFGNLFFLRNDSQPFAFFQNNDGWFLNFIYNLGFAFVGTGIGYLSGSAFDSSEESFQFTASDGINLEEWERLRRFVSEEDRGSDIHISFQGAWVNSTLPNSEEKDYYNYYGDQVSNLNMMRKIQLTLTLTKFVDGGLAIVWLGQPSSRWRDSSALSTLSMEGVGYYVVGVVKPLHTTSSQKVEWDIGGGAGFAKVDYRSTPGYYYYGNPFASTPAGSEIKKTLFSVMIYTELRISLADYLSLGVVADYTYLPEKTSSLPNVKVESAGLGTTSIGFAVGIHF